MTDTNALLRSPSQPEDDAAREARHQVLATLLGAYADGELPTETASQIDAHLLGCGRCRSELQVQRVVRDRLSRSTVPTATVALQDRIRAAVAATPVPVLVETPAPSVRIGRRWLYAVTATFVIAFVLAGTVLRNRAPSLVPPPLVASGSVPVLASLLDDARRVGASDLPGRARDLDAVRAAVSFPVVPLASREVHLLGAWTTDLDGEPAAVLAYRWQDRVVLHYVVGEPTLFRSHELRSAFAEKRAVVTQRGVQGLLIWPDASVGDVLVGDVPWDDLVAISRATRR
jgi:anti-sigma factor RsiW